MGTRGRCCSSGFTSGRGLKALQAASIAAGLPFSIVMVMMTLGMFHSMLTEPEYKAADDYEPVEDTPPSLNTDEAVRGN